MFTQFFGDYLITKHIITEEQLNEILNYQNSIHMNLTIPDSSKEKAYLSFVQAATETAVLTPEDITIYLTAYQKDLCLTDEDMECLKNEDVDTFVKLYSKVNEPLIFTHISFMLSNLIRFIRRDISFHTAYHARSYAFEALACQRLAGTNDFFVGIAGNEQSLIELANPYAKENFSTLDEDVFDAISEFINCVNGIFSRNLSELSIEEDMLPPQSYANQKIVSEGTFYVLPLFLGFHQADLILSVNETLTIQ